MLIFVVLLILDKFVIFYIFALEFHYRIDFAFGIALFEYLLELLHWTLITLFGFYLCFFNIGVDYVTVFLEEIGKRSIELGIFN